MIKVYLAKNKTEKSIHQIPVGHLFRKQGIVYYRGYTHCVSIQNLEARTKTIGYSYTLEEASQWAVEDLGELKIEETYED